MDSVRKINRSLLIILALVLVACGSSPENNSISGEPIPGQTETPGPSQTPELTSTPTLEPTITPTKGPKPTLSPEDWKNMPVIPTEVSDTVVAIYQLGQLRGNNPNAFSKVGDSNSDLPYFFGGFDKGSDYYKLGDYEYLQETIEYFSGSFNRQSRASKKGMSAGAVLTPLWTDWEDCFMNEPPLACEFRIHQPSFAIISLGSNDAYGYGPFEDKVRTLLDFTIGNGVIPIIATKADNLEGNHYVNQVLVALAYEYEIPLWNFWAAIQPLPGNGLQQIDLVHLTYQDELNRFDFENLYDFELEGNLEYAWPVRNLTGLQVLDAIRSMLEEKLP